MGEENEERRPRMARMTRMGEENVRKWGTGKVGNEK